MPIINQWYNAEQTIYTYTVTGQLDWDEVRTAVSEGWQEIAVVKHPVNVLLDVSQAVDVLPPGLFTYGIWILRDAPSNIHLRVIAGMKPRSRSALALFLRINAILSSTRRLYFYETPEEGYVFFKTNSTIFF